jgi:hypothetical protein
VRLPWRILVLGAVGLSLAAGVGVTVSHLAGRQIGLAGEPLRDLRQLAPPQAITTTASRQRTRRTKAPRTTTVPVPTPAPAPADGGDGEQDDHQAAGDD